MKSFAFLILAFILLPVSGQSYLRTRGVDMVDESGSRILLQGVGLGNWLLPEGYMWKFEGKADRPRNIEKLVIDLIGEEESVLFWKEFRKQYITEADIRKIAELGFNSVRPAMNARLFLTEGPEAVFLEEGFQLLDSLISWCKKYNVYVILDMHGAPGGQTGANIDDSPADKPELFMDPVNQDRLVDLWVRIAQRYHDEPIVAAYDLLNEPLPENTGAAAKYGSLVEPLYKRITKAIRAVDQKHMITVEGINWANDWSIFSDAFDPNLFHQFHFYCWDEPDNLRSVDYYVNMREKLGTPVWIGETGEQKTPVYWGTTQYFESINMGWSFWPWKKMDTRNTPYSIVNPENWEMIIDYTAGGPKPDRTIATKAFGELLENIKLENCVYFPDVVNSMFRRVPVRVEAENYGHKGFKHSYFVHDTAFRSGTYRVSEPVPVFVFDKSEASEDNRQYIRITSDEWVVWDVNSLTKQALDGRIKVKGNGGPAKALVTVGAQSAEITAEPGSWQELTLLKTVFNRGTNSCRVQIVSGDLSVDYIDFR